ncbi:MULTISPECIES: hypothetical protein [Thermocrispum]|uniref:phage shock envelope stress response protein PspM n=1 Tax=Thermocrispum TaxID=37924 RepID=UPI0012EC86C8|nr:MULTISPECIES: hypothetical protein [Thermocrispum]
MSGPMDLVRRPDLRAIAAEAARQWLDFTDPAARHRRRTERARRGVFVWSVLAVLSTVAIAYGNWVFLTALLVTGALAVRSAVKLRRLNAMTPPPPRRLLPAKTSVAREPLHRLQRAEASLHDLLEQLSARGSGVTVDEVSVAQARQTAAQAASALHQLGQRIVAVERARDAAPAGQRQELTEAIRQLRAQLDEGIESYGGLIAAAGKAVAARDSGVAGAQAALTDATDRLAGMASALRELNGT